MFEWKPENGVLRKSRHEVMYKHYEIEEDVSIEDKLEFVNSLNNGKLSTLIQALDENDVEPNPFLSFKFIIDDFCDFFEGLYSTAIEHPDTLDRYDFSYKGLSYHFTYGNKDMLISAAFHSQLEFLEKIEQKAESEETESRVYTHLLGEIALFNDIMSKIVINEENETLYIDNGDEVIQANGEELSGLISRFQLLNSYIEGLH